MLKVFAVYDEKSEAYGSLICCATRGLALRAFADACADQRSPMYQYPSDFKLMELGDFEPNSGRITGLVQPAFVATAVQVLTAPKKASEVSA